MNGLDYLRYIRSMGCAICRRDAEPHHLEAIGMGRDRKKDLKEHYSAVPLCREHHTEFHQTGHSKFQKRYNINLWKECFKYIRHYALGEDLDVAPRSDRQNKYYWKTIGIMSSEFGYSRREMHQTMKSVFGIKSTKELSQSDMSDYIEQVLAFSAEQGLHIPD